MGINLIGRQAYNSLVTPGRIIPWLQDTSASTGNVNERWQAVYRDVIIVDESNFAVSVYNLTAHDLALPANRAELKQMLLNAAQAVDGDADKLPDLWENKFARGNYVLPGADLDGDGFNHFVEFAFGSNPANAENKPTTVLTADAAGKLRLTFKRWPGNLADYHFDASLDLQNWQLSTPELSVSATRNLYDGSGYVETEVTSQSTVWSEQARFFRVRAVPKP